MTIYKYPWNARENPHILLQRFEYQLPSVDNSSSRAGRVSSGVNRGDAIDDIFVYIPSDLAENVQTSWDKEDISASIQAMTEGAGIVEGLVAGGKDLLKGVESFAPGTLSNVTNNVAAGAGTVIRPNDILIISEIGHYEIDFQWDLEPNTPDEGVDVMNLVKRFRRWSQPTLRSNEGLGREILDYPPLFDIYIRPIRDAYGAASSEKDRSTNNLFFYQNMVISSFDVSYGGGANEALFYNDGTPIKMTLKVGFKALRGAWNQPENQSATNSNQGAN
jgi:hypothetical protein